MRRRLPLPDRDGAESEGALLTPTLLEAATALSVLGTRVLRARPRAVDDDHEHAEDNTYGLPDGAPISAELREWLRRQREAVLAAIPDDTIPAAFPDLTAADWTDPMAKRMTPLLASYWDDSGKSVFSRLGLDPDAWRVVNPHLERQIAGQALAFCQSTNDTTSKRIGDALRDLRAELTKGMVEEGESVRELAKRVQYVFESMSTSHATMIAATEASRAVHAAELAADVESEVVAGLELLLSSDACALCRKIATECKRVRLGEAFAVIGNNPHYKDVRHPPLHPHCQCTMIEVLKPEYGGPVAPDWGQTLQQPQKGLGDEYKPPAGTTVPKPEPNRPKPVPTAAPPKAKPVPPQSKTDEAVAKKNLEAAADFARKHGVGVIVDGRDILEKSITQTELKRVPGAFIWNSKASGIALNQDHPYWKDQAAWMAASNKSDLPYFSTSDPNHLIVHEVAHAEHFKKLGYQDMALMRGTPLSSKQIALAREQVSRYAGEDRLEFVAEVYAGTKHGRLYSEDIMQIYRASQGPDL